MTTATASWVRALCARLDALLPAGAHVEWCTEPLPHAAPYLRIAPADPAPPVIIHRRWCPTVTGADDGTLVCTCRPT